MEAILPSHPVTYKQLMRASFKLYRASFSYAILLAFIVSFLAFLPRFIANMTGLDFYWLLPPSSPHRLWFALINVVSLIFFIGIIWHMFCVLRNRHEPFIEDFSVGLKKVWLVFIAAIIQNLILFSFVIIFYGVEILARQYHLFTPSTKPITAWLIVAIFMGEFFLLLYIAALFIFLIPLIAVENKGVFSAISRSFSLVWNHWFKVISVQLTPWIAYFLVLTLFQLIFKINMDVYFLGNSPENHWIMLVNFIVFAFFIPWIAALLLLQLKDLELRKELSQTK